ncbi:5189_t:CDS:1, partial [Cetraspora pellucida]
IKEKKAEDRIRTATTNIKIVLLTNKTENYSSTYHYIVLQIVNDDESSDENNDEHSVRINKNKTVI